MMMMMMMALAYSVGLALASIVAIHPLLSVVVLCRHHHLHVFPIERAFRQSQPAHDLDSVRTRDQARHARMLQGVVDFSVHGSSDPFRGGIYYTKVKLGSPPREYYVQIDTGSDVMWVGCSSCSNCPITSQLASGGIGLNLYDSAASSTANTISCSDPICTTNNKFVSSCLDQTNQCGYSFHYGDGSATSGYYVSDDIHFNIVLDQSLDANSSASITFGCSTYLSGDLVNTDKADDGILGFGPGPMSVISQLSNRAIFPRVFSHCLKGGLEGGGTMIIGQIDDPDIVYSPLVPSRPHYNLKMVSIGVNGQVLGVDPSVFATSNNRGTIVDSGTTLTYLVQEAFDPFVNAINASVAQEAVITPLTVKGTQCYLATSTSDTILKSFPSVTLNFDGGASMHLNPEEYLVPIDSIEGSPTWCIGFQRSEHGVSILGDLVLKDKIIVYDLAQQQIGWANYNCSMSMNISTRFGRDKFIYETEFNASHLVKESICLCLLLASLVHFLYLS